MLGPGGLLARRENRFAASEIRVQKVGFARSLWQRTRSRKLSFSDAIVANPQTLCIQALLLVPACTW